jgi:hypothetical protein
MDKPSPIKKIERHWTEYMIARGENPLKHALRSYHDWYQIRMSRDTEIDIYYKQIYESQSMLELNKRITKLNQVEHWVITERDEIHRLISLINPYN